MFFTSSDPHPISVLQIKETGKSPFGMQSYKKISNYEKKS